MSHNKIKTAARRRMTATGEPYAAARRQSIAEHNAAQFTSPISAEDIRAAAEVHQELGPGYSDAVVAAFIDRVDRAVAARVEARLADGERSVPAKAARRGNRWLGRRLPRDVLAASLGALVAVGAVGLYENARPHPVPPVIKHGGGACASKAGSSQCSVLPPASGVRLFVITGDGQIKAVTRGPGSMHQ